MTYTKRIISLTFLLKIGYFLVAILVHHLGLGVDYLSWNPRSWLYIFCSGDSLWYHTIFDCGYDTLPNLAWLNDSQFNYAFFPLYPYLIKFFATLFHTDFFPIAFFFSVISSITAFLLSFKVINLFLKDEAQSYHAVLALMLFPFHFFFSVYYTEVLFLALMMGGFWAIFHRKWWLLAIFVAGLTLTRPNGIFTAFSLFLFFLWNENFFSKGKYSWKDALPFLAFAASILALFWHLYNLHAVTGDYFVFSKAAAAWGRKTTFPFASLFNQGILAVQLNSVFCILYTLIAIFGLRKQPLPLQFLVWINLLLIVSTGQMVSIPRYFSVLFPFSIFFAQQIGNRYWVYALLGGLQLFTYVFFLTGNPIGF